MADGRSHTFPGASIPRPGLWRRGGLAQSQLSAPRVRPLLNTTATAGKAIVAAKDLPVGATITEQDVRVIDSPGNAVPAGLIATPQDAIGRGLMSPVRLNEPLLDSKLAPRGGGTGMNVIIEQGSGRSASGSMMLSASPDSYNPIQGSMCCLPWRRKALARRTPRPALQNIEALAIGQTTQTNAQGQAQVVPVVTVLVTPEQAETLALAASQGRIQMAMRNQLDTLPIKTNGARVSALMGPVRAAGPPTVLGYRRSAGGPVTQRAPAQEETIVEGFRGGERSITRFSRTKPPEDRDN